MPAKLEDPAVDKRSRLKQTVDCHSGDVVGKTTGQGEEQARRWVQPTLTKLLLKMKLVRLPSSGIEGLCSSGRGEFPKK